MNSPTGTVAEHQCVHNPNRMAAGCPHMDCLTVEMAQKVRSVALEILLALTDFPSGV